jgi:hypothetical protein
MAVLRLLSDENFNGEVVWRLMRRLPVQPFLQLSRPRLYRLEQVAHPQAQT